MSCGRSRSLAPVSQGETTRPVLQKLEGLLISDTSPTRKVKDFQAGNVLQRTASIYLSRGPLLVLQAAKYILLPIVISSRSLFSETSIHLSPSDNHSHLQLVFFDNDIPLGLQLLNVPVGAQVSSTQPLASLLNQPKQE